MICVEFLPLRELARPDVVRLLVGRRVAPMVAVRDGEDEAALDALRPYLEAGLAACAWPLLDDAAGYWPSVMNVGIFSLRVEALLARATARGLRLPWIAVDLEPPVDAVMRVRRSPVSWSFGAALVIEAWGRESQRAFHVAEREYAALHKKMLHCGTRGLAIAYPLVAADFPSSTATSMQRLFNSPLRCGWDRVALMTYGSMVSGYSRGAITVEDARWYGYRALGQMAAELGHAQRVGAFVGVVGHGKLGDEPSYDDPGEVALDAAAARAAGAGEVSLFCLEGVLARPRPEAWLDALAAPARRPPFRWRGELLHRSINAAAATIDAVKP